MAISVMPLPHAVRFTIEFARPLFFPQHFRIVHSASFSLPHLYKWWSTIMERNDLTKEVIATIRTMKRCWIAGWNEDQFRKCIYSDGMAYVPTTSGRLGGQEHLLSRIRGSGSGWSLPTGSHQSRRSYGSSPGMKNSGSAFQNINTTGINGHMINT